MKRVFVAYERHAQGGKLFLDADGCAYLKPHSHPVLAGREFALPLEAIQVVSDYNIQNPSTPFKGEFILLEIVSL